MLFLLPIGIIHAGQLPLDPGSAANMTLQGVDSDKNGIRDDIERWIAINFPGSLKTQNALKQQAKAIQRLLIESNDPSLSRANAHAVKRADACLAYIHIQKYPSIRYFFRAITVNTFDRANAWIEAYKHFPASEIIYPKTRREGCDFNPDVLPESTPVYGPSTLALNIQDVRLAVPNTVYLTSWDTKPVSSKLSNLGEPTVSSPFEPVTVTSYAPSYFPVGDNLVIWVAVDAKGRSVANFQKVVVIKAHPSMGPLGLIIPPLVNKISQDGKPVHVDLGEAKTNGLNQPIELNNNAPELFPTGKHAVIWTAKNSKGQIASDSQQVIIFDGRVLDGLPSDLGDKGKETLVGMDVDQDGVRDDVQRWIALNYQWSEKTRAALRQNAKIMQEFLLYADNPDMAYKTSLISGRAGSCLAYVNEDFYDISSELKAKLLNTYKRSKAYLQADRHLSGKMYKSLPYKQRKQGCNFDPDTMPN